MLPRGYFKAGLIDDVIPRYSNDGYSQLRNLHGLTSNFVGMK